MVRLICDLAGTEFGGRQLQYDMVYSAAQHIADMRARVDRCLAQY